MEFFTGRKYNFAMVCKICTRDDLPETAFYPNDLTRCRDCVKRGNKGTLKRATRACPICRTQEVNLFLHYTRWHQGMTPPDVASTFPPHEPLEASSNEALVRVLLAARPLEDVHRIWTPGEGRVYFLQAGGPVRPIKIGWSLKLSNRIAELQIGCPDPLRVLHTYASKDASEEDRLHILFREFHIHGEWFRAEARLLGAILELATNGVASTWCASAMHHDAAI